MTSLPDKTIKIPVRNYDVIIVDFAKDHEANKESYMKEDSTLAHLATLSNEGLANLVYILNAVGRWTEKVEYLAIRETSIRGLKYETEDSKDSTENKTAP